MIDATIIYYTNNHEDEIFEKKIRDNILKNSGGLPIISVSHKPIDFGKNICVGTQTNCDFNATKQLLIGLKEAKTTFAIAAESDVLYPPEYFSFTPPTLDNVYRYTNVWILYAWVGANTKGRYWKKRLSEGAQMCGREYWINKIETVLDLGGHTEWGTNLTHHPKIFKTLDQYSWSTENPVISFKTTNGLRKYIGTTGISAKELPFWGLSDELRKKYI